MGHQLTRAGLNDVDPTLLNLNQPARIKSILDMHDYHGGDRTLAIRQAVSES